MLNRLIGSGLIVAIGMLMTVTPLSAGERLHGGPYYFESFKTKSMPEDPVGRLSDEEVARRASTGTYYMAYFNDRGQLARLTKRRHGQVDWESEYSYDDNGRLISGRTTSRSSEGALQIDRTFGLNGDVVTKKSSVKSSPAP